MLVGIQLPPTPSRVGISPLSSVAIWNSYKQFCLQAWRRNDTVNQTNYFKAQTVGNMARDPELEMIFHKGSQGEKVRNHWFEL